MTPRRGECKSTSGRVPLQFRFPIDKKILAIFSTSSHHKPEKPRKFRFQIEDIGTIFQRFPSQAKKKHGNPVFKKNSKRRYWHYFPDKPKKPRKSRFQMRFPITSQKKQQKSCFQIEEALFSRSSITSQKNHGNSVFK